VSYHIRKLSSQNERLWHGMSIFIKSNLTKVACNDVLLDKGGVKWTSSFCVRFVESGVVWISSF